jgi:hypothetical protein
MYSLEKKACKLVLVCDLLLSKEPRVLDQKTVDLAAKLLDGMKTS